ncbi:uncharacterized protein LOC112906156 [Agrilus planipennis]|uniref:Uncharacterized protein LOC112906156 n=1 Tax=Agrilus planipennis TaxID=224129 RepID=A0A7F5RI70_AGRPL|nr:uncharacterized protein LOC112906156 [Agrilus planipennis]
MICEPLSMLENKVTSNVDNLEVKEEIKKMISCFQNMFSNLRTEWKRFDFFKRSSAFIPVESLLIGTRENDKRIKQRTILDIVESHIQYVPIEKTLQAFLQIPNVFRTISCFISNLSNVGSICNIMQSALWADMKHNEENKLILPIFIYFDEFEINNPLGSHAGIYKIGATYFVLGCLPPQFASQLENIFLLQLHYSEDRKTFGNSVIFAKIIESCRQLEEHGINISTESGDVHVWFSVAFVLGDNLGVNAIMGLTESFSATNFCRFCYATKHLTQTQLREDESLIRTREKYTSDVKTLSNGIKENCIWNSLSNFHITSNMTCDVMHDIYEGKK